MQTGGTPKPMAEATAPASGTARKGCGKLGTKSRVAKQAGKRLQMARGACMAKSEVRRLARRAGVKRISAGIYEDCRDALTQQLHRWIGTVATLVEYAGRKTVTPFDVVYALKVRLFDV